MATTPLASLKKLLAAGQFSDLKGTVEGEYLDFKDQPYQTVSEKGKYALLEDVSAFANHEGGAIVLGCRTISTTLEGDVVDAVRPIALVSVR